MSRDRVVPGRRESSLQVQLWAVGLTNVEIGQTVRGRIVHIETALRDELWRVRISIHCKLYAAGAAEICGRVAVVLRTGARNRQFVNQKPLIKIVFAASLQASDYCDWPANLGIK